MTGKNDSVRLFIGVWVAGFTTLIAIGLGAPPLLTVALIATATLVWFGSIETFTRRHARRAAELADRARGFLESDAHAAARAFAQVVALNPSKRYWFEYARALHKAGDLAAAKHAYLSARSGGAEYHGDVIGALSSFQLAKICLSEGDPKWAIEYSTQGLDRLAGNLSDLEAEGRLTKGLALWQAGQAEAGRQEMRLALERARNPDLQGLIRSMLSGTGLATWLAANWTSDATVLLEKHLTTLHRN
jgi:hypothetical protein